MPQQQGQEVSGKKAAFGFFLAIVSGLAWCPLVFLRWNLGRRVLGVRGIAAVVVMFAYCALAKCPEIVPFFQVWMVAVILQTVNTALRSARGIVTHSRDAGDYLVMKIFRFIRRPATARLLEVAICFAVGVWVFSMSEGFGAFVLMSSFAMGVVAAMDEQVMKNRVQAMHDAEIEHKTVADVYRGRTDY